MKQELDYIRIDGALGGNQDWFTASFMKGGGCAAVKELWDTGFAKKGGMIVVAKV